MKRILWTLFFTVALLALGTAVVAALNLRGEAALPAESQALSQAVPATPELVARGEYLARAGNCMACHTVQVVQASTRGPMALSTLAVAPEAATAGMAASAQAPRTVGHSNDNT